MTATPSDSALAAKLAALSGVVAQKRKVSAEIERGRASDPLAFATRLPWQEVVYALTLGLPWRPEWGPPPSMPPRLIAVIASNQIGKSTIGGMVGAAHLAGVSARFPKPGHVWFGMPRLEDSVEVQRQHVERWLPKRGTRWLPRHPGGPTTTLVDTQAGGHGRFKAYEQGLDAWESQTVQGVIFDEPPSDDLIAAARTRTMREDGYVLIVMTPLKDEMRNPSFKGTGSQLYKDAWLPWLEHKRTHPAARWAEVSPGVWTFALTVMENARSRGGFLPDDRIHADRQKLISEGKPLEAAVRYDGEWVDIASDSLLPHEAIKEWSTEPAGGFRRVVAWIDPAFSAKTASCETAIAIWASDGEGRCYQIESKHGRWESALRVSNCADLLAAYGFPDAGVQRTPGDIMFSEELNRELMRRGGRACVRPRPETGPVPGKVERANMFAPMIANGQVFIRPEHVVFREQAQRLSAEYVRRGGECDVVDAGMGAALMLVDSVAPAMYQHAFATSAAFARGPSGRDTPGDADSVPSWAWTGGRDLLDEVD